MSQSIQVNGQTINYPETGDTNWSDDATNFAIQTSAALGKIGLSSGTSVDITQTLDVTGNTTLDANLSVGGNASVTGSTTIAGTLGVIGNTTVDGVIYADDNTTANTPVISFTGDTNTGLGRSAADTLDFITNGNSRFRIEPTGQIKAVYESQVGTDYNTQLDNGYLCRAWVNIDGTATQRTGSYTISGTTITVNITSHGLTTGNFAQLDFASGDGVDGRYQVTVINANSYTVTNPVSGSLGGAVTQDAMIRASGNVSSITDNTIGDYTVNFTTTMPDINYCAIGTNGFNSVGSGTYAGFNRNPSTGGEIAPTTSGIRYTALLNGSVVTQDCKYNYIAVFR